MIGHRLGLGALAVLLACSMPMASGMQSDLGSQGVPRENSGVLEDPALELNQTDRMPRALETDAFNTKDIIATSGWIESAHVADWLGPLAPVALSPFFGITCLSGLALWGPDWIAGNALLGSAGPLQNPTLFFVFLGLTLLTSVPRFTKVSKPFAQAVDRIETYSVIVILLVVKIISSIESDDGATTHVALVQLGVLSFSANTLLAVAMVVNVLVINSVKFFFEFLVWLTPVPFLDACFEVLNKTLCAGLMALYVFSPTLATLVNLILLVMAAVVLRWISRRVRFYRTMVLDPIIARLWQDFGTPKRPELIVFPRDAFGPFAAKSRLKLVRRADGDGWELSEANWWRRQQSHVVAAQTLPRLRRGWVMHRVEVSDVDGQTAVFCFSRRYDAHLPRLAQQLNVELEINDAVVKQDRGQSAGEFA